MGGIVLSIVRIRGAAWPVVAGMIASLIGMIWVHSTGAVHWPWYTLIGAGILFLVSVPLLLLAKPKPEVEA